jgi:pyroglutamyl-peptidase
MALTILLTGFGPFPGAPLNPTDALVTRLAKLRRPALADVRLVPHVFQTSYRAVDRDLPRLMTDVKPDALLMFGLSGRAKCLRVEMRARNAVSSLIRDVEGRGYAACIVPGGVTSLPFRSPAAKLALASRKARVQAVTSRDAGRYLCNYLCWRAIEAAGPSLAVFVHVPKLRHGSRRRGKRQSWRMADVVRGGEAILLSLVAATRQQRHMKER